MPVTVLESGQCQDWPRSIFEIPIEQLDLEKGHCRYLKVIASSSPRDILQNTLPFNLCRLSFFLFIYFKDFLLLGVHYVYDKMSNSTQWAFGAKMTSY